MFDTVLVLKTRYLGEDPLGEKEEKLYEIPDTHSFCRFSGDGINVECRRIERV